MDSIGNIFGSLGGALGSKGGQTALGLGLGIPSIIGQIMQGRQQSNYINSVLGLMKAYQNPAFINSQMAKLTPALSQNLVQSISNPVQAFLGERGLSQAPGIAAAAETQALAPYAQQNQQTAASLLGLPLTASGTGSYAFMPQQQSSLDGILKLIMGGPQTAQKATATPNWGNLPMPTPLPSGNPNPPLSLPPPDMPGLTFPSLAYQM